MPSSKWPPFCSTYSMFMWIFEDNNLAFRTNKTVQMNEWHPRIENNTVNSPGRLHVGCQNAHVSVSSFTLWQQLWTSSWLLQGQNTKDDINSLPTEVLWRNRKTCLSVLSFLTFRWRRYLQSFLMPTFYASDIVNLMVADVLATPGAKVSSAMVLS